MEKSNKKNAHEVRTTTVEFPTLKKRFPQRIGKLLDDIHNCRDCQRCYKHNDMWHCYVGNVDHEGKPIQFKHHRICCCIDFLARPPKNKENFDYEKKRYYEEGEVFGLGRGIYQVHEADGKYWRKEPIVPGGECFSCCFRMKRGKGACVILACHADEREDGKEVVFERI